MKKLLLIGAATMIAPLMSSADGHSCIISGDPIAASTENSCATASSGTALVTGALSAPTVAGSLESRFRTWLASAGVALRSDKLKGRIIILD